MNDAERTLADGPRVLTALETASEASTAAAANGTLDSADGSGADSTEHLEPAEAVVARVRRDFPDARAQFGLLSVPAISGPPVEVSAVVAAEGVAWVVVSAECITDESAIAVLGAVNNISYAPCLLLPAPPHPCVYCSRSSTPSAPRLSALAAESSDSLSAPRRSYWRDREGCPEALGFFRGKRLVPVLVGATVLNRSLIGGTVRGALTTPEVRSRPRALRKLGQREEGALAVSHRFIMLLSRVPAKCSRRIAAGCWPCLDVGNVMESWAVAAPRGAPLLCAHPPVLSYLSLRRRCSLSAGPRWASRSLSRAESL